MKIHLKKKKKRWLSPIRWWIGLITQEEFLTQVTDFSRASDSGANNLWNGCLLSLTQSRLRSDSLLSCLISKKIKTKETLTY